MIDLMKLPANEAERLAYAEGFTGTAELFGRIDALEAQVAELAELADRLPVRYFIVDYESEDGPDLIEVTEHEFTQAPGRITYERHTMRENGVNQICLTKGLDA